MEIRHLIRIFVEKWWLVVPTFLITVGATVAFTFTRPAVYESTSTYIVKTTNAIGNDVLSALSILSRQTEIAETYVQAAQSRKIQDQAIAALSLDARQQADVELEGRLVPGTNLLQLAVQATDRQLATDYCNAVGTALVSYANGLYPSFKLTTLDAAMPPDKAVSPNVPLNLALGIAIGLVLGAGVAIVAETVTPSSWRQPEFDLLDKESSAYSGAFFLLRLRQEISRARRTGSHVAIALINVNHTGILDSIDPRSRRSALRRLAGLLDSHLRSEDLSARLEADTFALLLPDSSEGEAISMVEALRGRISAPAVGGPGGDAIRVNPAAGVAEFHREPLTAEALLDRARRALRDAETVPAGTTQHYSILAAEPAASRRSGAPRSTPEG